MPCSSKYLCRCQLLLASDRCDVRASAAPLCAVDAFNRGHYLADAALELQQDDGYARRVGEAGARLVGNALAPHRVQAYWRRLLQRYWELQAFNATRVHPDAVPLERSILVPEVSGLSWLQYWPPLAAALDVGVALGHFRSED